MTQRIIYQNDNGGVAVVTPAPQALEVYGIDAIAKKDVPVGKPYKIVEDADLPADYVFFGAWEVDPTTLTDGVGSVSNEFPG